MCFKPLFPVLEYTVNYDYITTVLCINKERPKLQCNGKCFLMKAIAREVSGNDDKKGNDTSRKTELSLLYLEKDVNISLLTGPEFYRNKNAFFSYNNIYFYLTADRPLRPPIVLS
ncbi:hypothetical protein [Sinomicrobium oceani]|uniref:hypothetical protein n=1 Tax=Sinomicrobium oceani TaxID=1150368 RepID=UPI00227A04BA|nr:hypothetical protein [Sinomicrobium oceani]